MLSRTRTGLKFLTYGILLGILFAPRSGAETRKSVMDWANSTIRGVMGGMSDNSANH